MQSTTDLASGLLKDRLAELDAERTSIEAALGHLNGDAPRRGRPKGTPAKRTTRKRSRKGGGRASEAVKLVAQNENITASDIAKTMKIKPNYLYRVLADLEKQGLVKKNGRQYTATAKGVKSVSGEPAKG